MNCDKNKSKYNIVVIVIVLLVSVASFTLAFFTIQFNGNNDTTVKVSSNIQTSLIFNKGDELSLKLNKENFSGGAGNVVSVTKPSVTLSSQESITENYVVAFKISDNTLEYTTPEKTPELILTVLDHNKGEVTNINGLNFISNGEVSGFDITEKVGLYEILSDVEITADNNIVTDEWTFTLTFMNFETDQILNAGKDFNAEIIMGQNIKEELTPLILMSNGGVEEIESKEADFNKAALSEEAYDTYGDWCTSLDLSLCSIDRLTKYENGMYATEDDEGTTYYYRGAVDNNWLIFGEEDGKPIYWRIIRIEGNGNIKLIYSGTTAPEEKDAVTMTGSGTQLPTGGQAFNFIFDGSMEYAGYVYEIGEQHGTTTDSDIKTAVDKWYKTTLETSFDEYVTSHNTCVDRVTYTCISDRTEDYYECIKNDPQEYFSFGSGYFGSGARIFYSEYINILSSLECEVEEDLLSLNVSLITADEVILAGGSSYLDNSSYYLYTSNQYWTISPMLFTAGVNFMHIVNGNGRVYGGYIPNALGVRPTISLLSTTAIKSGSGTYDNPYIVS